MVESRWAHCQSPWGPGVVACGRCGIEPSLDLDRKLRYVLLDRQPCQASTNSVILELIAAQFDLHPRALHWRLCAEKIHLRRTHRERAPRNRRTLPARHRVSLSHLTRELGHAEQSVLSRSCRRWFGCGPSRYRNAIRGAPNRSQAGPETLHEANPD